MRSLIRAGVPEPVAIAMSGQKMRTAFGRYNIVGQEDLKEALKKQKSYVSDSSRTHVELARTEEIIRDTGGIITYIST